MATCEVTFGASFGNGKSIAVLEELIAKREQYLKGETTEYAVTATAVNVLKSIRAGTKRADPEKASNGFRSEMRSSLVPGFKSANGSKKGHRVLRSEEPPAGHEICGVPVINISGKYCKGEVVHGYICVFKYQTFSTRTGNGERYNRFYVIARSQGDVDAWAKRRLKKYIEQYAGMAKWILGHAMYLVVKSNKYGDDDPTVKSYAKRKALAQLSVQTAGVGWSQGHYSVSVHDDLKYADFALSGGIATLDMALMKAANSTAAIINRIGALPLDKKIETPFPEVSGKK